MGYFWLHCNRCSSKNTRDLHVTNCGHIYCSGCVSLCLQRSACSRCPNTRIQSVQLAPNTLKPEVKRVFENIEERLPKILKSAKFQMTQYKILVASLRHRTKILEDKVKEADAEKAALLEEVKRLRSRQTPTQARRMMLDPRSPPMFPDMLQQQQRGVTIPSNAIVSPVVSRNASPALGGGRGDSGGGAARRNMRGFEIPVHSSSATNHNNFAITPFRRIGSMESVGGGSGNGARWGGASSIQKKVAEWLRSF